MAWIRTTEGQESDRYLSRLIARHADRETGRLDHILAIHGQDPPTMEDHLRLYKRLMYGESELTRTQREMIAVAVSVENRCHY
ncbi:MAG: carboxymuconolactone decarboxylase family protein [Fidelibacterota bacterium]